MKSTKWKTLGIILGILAVVVIAAALMIPRFLDLNRYHGLITSELEKAMGGKVTLGHISWGITHGIWLEADGFTVEGATAFPGDIALSRLYAKVSILPLLSRKVVVDTLLLESPVVAVRLAPSTARGEKAADKPDSAPPTAGDDAAAADKQSAASSPLPVKIMIEQLNIDKGRIRLEDSLTLPSQKMVYTLTDVEIEAKNLAPGQPMVFQLALRDEFKPGLGALKGQGTFSGLTEALTIENPELKLKATLAGLDTAMIKPYLKNKPLAERMSGSISLEVDYAGDFGQHLSAAGKIDLTHFAYEDPSLWEKPIPGAETQATYQVRLDPDQIIVEKLNLKLGNLSLNAHALVQDWRKEAIIKNGVLSSNLPLVELIPLVPWGKLGKQADVIRQALAGGGEVIVENVVLPELIAAKISAEPKALLSRAEASIELSDMSMGLSPELPKLEHITGTLQLEKGVLTATDMRARLGPLTLPPIEARATNLTGKVKVSAVAKGPMTLVGTTNGDVEKLLRQYGLKSLTGSAEIDLQVKYDQARPQSWDASGHLVLQGVEAISHPAGVRLDDLEGRVTLNRQKTLDITLEDLMARVNQAAVELEGRLSGVGSPRLVVDAKVRTEQLDLAHLSALFLPLKALELGGKLDMDVAVYYPRVAAEKSRLNGVMEARGLGVRLAAQNITVANTDAHIVLAGTRVKIDDMTLLLNDQQMSVWGQVTNFRAPTAQLQVKSTNLNVDRLLPPTRETQPPSKPPAKKEGAPKTGAPSEKEAGKSELPPFLRTLNAQLQVEAARGTYRGEEFQDLSLKATYERGVLKSHEFDVRFAGGRIQTTGSADLRNLERIPFKVQPNINAVRLEEMAPLLGIDKVSAHGPVTITGQVQGRTGSARELLGSLLGNLEGEIGPGRLHKLDSAGDALFKLLTFINLKSIFSGKMADDSAGKGIPYDSLHVGNSFQDGKMSINKLHLKTPALTLDGQGMVDLLNRQLNVNADVQALGTVDKVVGFIPVLGKSGEKLTNVYLNIHGSLEDPKVAVRPARGVVKAVVGGAEAPEKDAEGVFKDLGKGFDTILGK